MMKRTGLIAAALFAFSATLQPMAAKAEPELVLTDGARLTARGGADTISVIAGSGLQRSFAIGGCVYQSSMRARDSRWYGSLGAYDPGFQMAQPSDPCGGLSRTVVQEGQIHFDDLAFARKWVGWTKNHNRHVAISSDGVLIGWTATPARQTLSVELWLMCFKGRPLRLGASGGLQIVGGGLRQCAQAEADAPRQTRLQYERR